MRSLSARLLVLTVFFVMLSEVFIFVPSVARFRMTYFDNHLAAAHLASLALAASPHGKLDQPMTNLILRDVGAHPVLLHRPNGMVFLAERPAPRDRARRKRVGDAAGDRSWCARSAGPPRGARHRRHKDQPRSARHPGDSAARQRWACRQRRAGGAPRRAAPLRSDRPSRCAVHPGTRLLAW